MSRIKDGIISKDEIKVSEWAGGKTEEIFIYPEDERYEDRKFIYRISMATIEADESEFTMLADYDRILMPLTDEVTIIKEDGEVQLSPFELLKFSGDERIRSRGKTRDLNLMIRKGKSGRMEVLTEISTIIMDRREPQIVLMFIVNEDGSFRSLDEIRFKNRGENLTMESTGNKTAVILSLPDYRD